MTPETPEPGPLVVTVKLVVKSSMFDRLLELVNSNAQSSLCEEPHCRVFDVLIPEPPGLDLIFLYEVYDDAAAFDHHLATPHYRQFDSDTRDIVVSKTVRTYRMQGGNGCRNDKR